MGVVVAHLFDVVPRGGLVLCVLLGLALGVDLPCLACVVPVVKAALARWRNG
ncbi:hypothetical protein [Kingella kingae]|uniref:hypothetical protein n=1 Tax=Kingella kingae TaxID=504 RepID=UPI00041D2B7E|nr:hypothetical protein [Kingella kingae]